MTLAAERGLQLARTYKYACENPFHRPIRSRFVADGDEWLTVPMAAKLLGSNFTLSTPSSTGESYRPR
jgi:hypothetical protein